MISNSNPPKQENFFGGVTMGAHDFDRGAANRMALSLDSMYYHQNSEHEALQHNHRHQQQQIQSQQYQDYSAFRGLYHTVPREKSNCTRLPTIGEDEENGIRTGSQEITNLKGENVVC